MGLLIRDHPFMDANKRTAIVATAISMQTNGWHFTASIEEVVHFTLACAQSQLSLQEITVWLNNRANQMA
jgi:death-on-curing protein